MSGYMVTISVLVRGSTIRGGDDFSWVVDELRVAATAACTAWARKHPRVFSVEPT